ncbi:unnamed protein product [Echinostoma caproni]|uniref:UmuC domain-containing protein n=1 Tax=Echinostoma caproni TaxID=27848 RepID=A0A183A1C0_9TREM|nr:unnamed protein product [Echinostoma caproni]
MSTLYRLQTDSDPLDRNDIHILLEWTLAKLACSLNKPNKQTLVPPDTAMVLLRATPVTKIRNLGGKLGTAIVNRFGIETLGQLAEISLSELIKEFGDKTA